MRKKAMRKLLLISIASLVLPGCNINASTTDALAQPQASQAMEGTLIVGNKGEDTVSFFSLKTGEEQKRVTTERMPHEVAISPDGRLAAVVAYGGKTIDFFQLTDGTKSLTVDLGSNLRPHGIAWLKDGRIMATTEGSDTLTILTPSICATGSKECSQKAPYTVSSIPTGNKGSHMLAVQKDGSRAYVSNLQSKNVTVIDLEKRSKIRDLDAGTEPEGIALTPDGRELWVAARGSDEIFVFDANTLEQIANIKTGRFPIRIAISPDGQYAVTSDLIDGGISVINTATKTLERKITVSGSQEAFQVTLIFSPDGNSLYLAETGRNTVAEVDFTSGEVLRRFNAGEDGDGLGISPVSFSN